MLQPRGGQAESLDNALSVEILAPELCPHYAGLPIGGVKIGPSPICITLFARRILIAT